jgi:hypothetical protein
LSLSFDEQRAVHRFRQWQAAQEPSPSTIEYRVKLRTAEERAADLQDSSAPEDDALDAEEIARVLMTGTVKETIPMEPARNYFRHLILTNPKHAAVELDIPHLAFYPEVPEKPEWTLATLFDFYADNARNKQGNPISKKNRDNSRRWWMSFLSVVEVKHYRELTKKLIKKYKDHVLSRFDIKEWSASTVRLQFSNVKAVLNFVRCMVHDPRKLDARQWSAQSNVSIVAGDATQPDSLRKAMEGCRAA